MLKRGLIIGEYDTVIAGKWLLTKLTQTNPEQVTNYVNVPGRAQGPLDLSTSLTDGEPVYGNRKVVATFESSEGNRRQREHRIDVMVNTLDGYIKNIILPDDRDHYLVGRVSVAKVYNDLAHASVQVTATCEPWRYNIDETVIVLERTTQPKSVTLPNQGRLTVVPQLTVDWGSVSLTVDGETVTLNKGKHVLLALALHPGGKEITYSGNGQLVARYREAML